MLLIILILAALGLLCYYFLIKPQLYWKSKNVKQGPPIPLLGDSLKMAFRVESTTEMALRVYNRFSNERYSGIYQTIIPTLILRDPELIKQITVKDFDHFTDHIHVPTNDIEPIFSQNLLFLKGERWRKLRGILSPAFTGNKMRLMFELMDTSAKQYVEYFLKQNKNVVEHELKQSFTRFANDVIANCAFGVTVDSLNEPDNDFFANSKALTNVNGIRSTIVSMIVMFLPKLASFLRLTLFPRATTEFFRNLFKNSVKMRIEQNIVRPDMIHILMEAQKGLLQSEENQAKEEITSDSEGVNKTLLTEEEMVAQVLIFFFAGFETISTAATYFCYELAVNPDIQDKLRKEIDEANREHNGKLSYDVLKKMKYLDMCLSESLRIHPPVPFIDRICTKPYTIEPVMADEEPLHLTPGEVCWLPIAGLHHDEKYFEKSEKYDPERFSYENIANINPYAYIPFGSGPRTCIASRFAIMEVKALVLNILSKFELVVIDKTTIPLKYDPNIMNPAILGGCWIGFKRRE